MQSLRIALALFSLVLGWFILLPAQPTLLNPPTAQQIKSPSVTGEIADSWATSPATSVEAAQPEANKSIRSIIPSPLTQGGDLKRMPAAASGAAEPITAEPFAERAAATQATAAEPADILGQTNDPEESVAALPDSGKPSFKLFARPVAVDSGTIKAGETTLRVAGIEPIAPEARCANGDQSWPCGVRARTAFRAWLRGRSLLCTIPPEGQDSRELTVPCLLGEEDVGAWLVSNGWAAASAGSRYKSAETQARDARRGIWAFEIEG